MHAGQDAGSRLKRNISQLPQLSQLSRSHQLVPGQPCIGFDTGPSNILMDAWIGARRGERFNRDGAWAAQGRVHEALLALCLADPYVAQPAPQIPPTAS